MCYTKALSRTREIRIEWRRYRVECSKMKKVQSACLRGEVRVLASARTCAKIVRVDYRKIITIEPGKRSGKPCIRGLRMTVYDVLSYLAAGMTTQENLKDFSYL